MLSALETQLSALLTARLPGQKVVAGPSAGPASATDERVELSGSGLSLERPPAADPDEGRDAAYVLTEVSFPSNGVGRTFQFPAGSRGELVEVIVPPGRILPPGDTWEIEYAPPLPNDPNPRPVTLRLYQAPPAGPILLARLKGSAAAGFREQVPCTLRLELHVWAKTLPKADERLGIALSALLSGLANLGVIDATLDPAQPPRMRLLSAIANLESLSRTFEKVGSANFFHHSARFGLRGQVELLVPTGAPAPTGRIRQLSIGGQSAPGARPLFPPPGRSS
jgi:hypothetical protein